VISAAMAEPMANEAIAAAATDLRNVRFVFMRILQLVRTAHTLARLCDGNMTIMTVLFHELASLVLGWP
jgi:hypothetical protein